jgi:plasmid maintenance system antidote protein VapI
MPTKPESLAEFVQRRMKELNDLSTYDVARLSGGRVSNGTVWNILNERVRDVKPDTLNALARALQVSEQEIYNVAHGREPLDRESATGAKLMIYFRELPQGYQEDLLRIAQTLHREHSLPKADVKSIKRKRRNVA